MDILIERGVNLFDKVFGHTKLKVNENYTESNIEKIRKYVDVQDYRHILNTLMQFSPDIIVMFDKHTNVLNYSHNSVFNILGYGPKELIGRKALDLVSPAGKPELVKLVNQENVLGVRNYKNSWKHKDGSYVSIDWNANVFGYNDDSIAIGRKCEVEDCPSCMLSQQSKIIREGGDE